MSFNGQIVEEGLMRVGEVANFLGLSRASVYQLMERGELPWAKLGRARRVPRRAVVDLAAEKVTRTEKPGRQGDRDGH